MHRPPCCSPRPQVVMLGDQMSIDEVVQYLRGAGYGTKINDRMGWYNVRPDAVEIFPGPDSYFDQEEGVIKFAGGKAGQDHLPARQHRAHPVPARAGADHQSLRPQSREAAHRPFRRDPEPPGAGHHFGRRQALLPALRLRSAAHYQGRLRRSPQGLQRGRRLDAQHAGGARLLADPGKDLEAQARRDDHHAPSRAEAQQGADLRVLRQPHRPGPARQFRHPRLRRGGAGLFRQGPPRPLARRGGHPRRAHPAAQLHQSVPPAGPGAERAATSCCS